MFARSLRPSIRTGFNCTGAQLRRRRQCRLLAALPSTSSSSPVDEEASRAELERLLPATGLEASSSVPPGQPGAASATGAAALSLEASTAEQHQQSDAGGPADPQTGFLAKLGLGNISGRAVGLLCMNLAVILYGTNWVVVKEGGAAYDPYTFCLLRFAVAAIALSPFLPAALREWRVMRAGLELGVWTGAGYLLQSEGLLTTDASRASFLSTFTVIIVPILVGLSGRGVRPLTWAAALAALAGVGLLEGGGSPPVLGDVWSLLSALAFGVQVFRTEHWSRQLGPKRSLPLTAVMLGMTACCALGASALVHPAATLDLAAHPWTAPQLVEGSALPWREALYTGLLTTDLCLLLEVISLRLISSTEAAIIFALEPVLGAAFAYALLGERWGPLGWAGAGLIIASSLASQLFGSEEGDPVAESGSESQSK